MVVKPHIVTQVTALLRLVEANYFRGGMQYLHLPDDIHGTTTHTTTMCIRITS
jgi:hypothetical protein